MKPAGKVAALVLLVAAPAGGAAAGPAPCFATA